MQTIALYTKISALIKKENIYTLHREKMENTKEDKQTFLLLSAPQHLNTPTPQHIKNSFARAECLIEHIG